MTENQSKASNGMKSLSSIFTQTSSDRSQHLLQNDHDVTARQGATLRFLPESGTAVTLFSSEPSIPIFL